VHSEKDTLSALKQKLHDKEVHIVQREAQLKTRETDMMAKQQKF